MKRNTKRIFSLLLVACMLLSALPVFAMTATAAEEEAAPTIKDYDTAKDGDLLYTVNFNGDDVYTPKKSSDTKDPVTITISEDGKTMTFSEKPKGSAAYYGGAIKDLRITGHVYTVSYFMEYADLTTMRAALQIFTDGQNKLDGTAQNYRIGVVNQKGNTNIMNVYSNGTVAEKTKTVDRMVDKENNNRQYFQIVIDGVNLSAKFYALDTNNNYSLLIDLPFSYQNNANYLVPGMFIWDIIGTNKFVTVGNVEIRKGDCVNAPAAEKTAYQIKYDNAKNGDVLYEVDFRNSGNEAGFNWGSVRATQNVAADSITKNSVTLNHTAGAAQIYASFLPDDADADYGCVTYEFFVSSDNRTTFNPLAVDTYAASAGYAIGFDYFNPNPAIMFSSGTSFGTDMTALGTHNFHRAGGGVYQAIQDPDTTNPNEPNVKIEIDTYSNTMTNYILKDGAWVKTAWIDYGGFAHKLAVYPYAWNANTNAFYSNVKIVKGLSISGESKKLVELKIGDTYPNNGMVEASALGSLGSLAGKDFYTAEYRLDDGTLVNSLDELTYTPGYNYVKLNVVYTPMPITDESGAEIRGIQTLKNAGETTTSVRFVGIVNSLDFDAVGVNVWIAYRKDGKTYLMKADEGVTKTTNNVFTQVKASGFTKQTADTLAGKYVYAVTIENVPIGDGVQVDFYVTPVTVKNGETNFGNEMEPISLVNGVYQENASPLEW